ncbi:DUF3168 domain-containing protein [Donghicola mangrovi]|uniref:DUF3168 domain-containing protein n=1 Tax=Donghicola mangrovi TaxID=2729614 RepID=A0A850Q457_9RHOB|nr:DUF3168 domain-containing protein [Donghicola mangrovi]NVO22822.1 DUF3168 domain-containing protein [Donghicola mangrovi]
MSYVMAAALQTALYDRLAGDAPMAALIGDAVFDAVPAGTLPETYVLLGSEVVRDLSDRETRAALHDFSVSVVSTASGFLTAKLVAAAIGRALEAGDLTLNEGRVVWLKFQKAQAKRTDTHRQIDLRYRAHVSAE